MVNTSWTQSVISGLSENGSESESQSESESESGRGSGPEGCEKRDSWKETTGSRRQLQGQPTSEVRGGG